MVASYYHIFADLSNFLLVGPRSRGISPEETILLQGFSRLNEKADSDIIGVPTLAWVSV